MDILRLLQLVCHSARLGRGSKSIDPLFPSVSRGSIPVVGELLLYGAAGATSKPKSRDPLVQFCKAMVSGLHEDIATDLSIIRSVHNDYIRYAPFELIYVDVICAAVSSGFALPSITIGVRERDHQPVVRLGSLKPTNAVRLNDLIRQALDYVTEQLKSSRGNHYALIKIRNTLETGLDGLGDIRDLLFVQHLNFLNARPMTLALYENGYQVLGSTFHEDLEIKHTLTVSEPVTVRCYQILRGSAWDALNANLLEIVELSEERVVLATDGGPALRFVEGQIALKVFVKLIRMCFSAGIVFDPSTLQIYQGGRAFIGKMRLLSGEEALSVYCRQPVEIDELKALRMYLEKLTARPLTDGYKSYFENVTTGTDEEFFYFPPDQDASVLTTDLGGDKFYRELTVQSSEASFDIESVLPWAQGEKVVASSIDAGPRREHGSDMINRCTHELHITREAKSKKPARGMDLTLFRVLEKVVYNDVDSLTASSYPPICPPSVKTLELVGNWDFEALKAAIKNLSDIDLTLDSFDFGSLPDDAELKNVESLSVVKPRNLSDIKKLRLPDLSRISVPSDDFPKASPQTLLIDSNFTVAKGAVVRFSALEIKNSDNLKASLGKLSASCIIFHAGAKFSRIAMEAIDLPELREIVFKGRCSEILDKNFVAKKKLEWTFEHELSLSEMRRICSDEEIVSGMVTISRLIVNGRELATLPKEIVLGELVIDLDEADSIDSLNPGHLSEGPNRVLCYPNYQDMTRERLEKLEKYARAQSIILGPRLYHAST